MNYPERYIEDWLFENPWAYDDEVRWCGRQVTVASGIIDLLGFMQAPEPYDDTFSVHVIELKAEPLKARHLTQVSRYSEDIYSQVRDIPGFGWMETCLIGPGHVGNRFLLEAQSMGITLREVLEPLALSRPWELARTAIEHHDSYNRKAVEKFIRPWVNELPPVKTEKTLDF